MEAEEFQDFTPDELPDLNRLMRVFPHVAYGFRAVMAAMSRLSFPVQAPSDLSAATSGGYGLSYGASEIPIDDLPRLMPAYYFPIESEDDFLAKVGDVCARVREPEGRNITTRLMEATAPSRGGTPPELDDAQILEMAGLKGRAAAPDAGGLRQRAGYGR